MSLLDDEANSARDGARRTGIFEQEPLEAFRTMILTTLGRAPDVIEPGCLHRFATSERRGDDAGWCKLFADLRGGVFGCHRQGISETWSAANRTTIAHEQRAELARQMVAATAEREAEQRMRWAENAKRIAQMWATCMPLSDGDPVSAYLERRGLSGKWATPAALRLHRAMPYWDGDKGLGRYPAMVAPIVSPAGRIVALHRTYLTADGRKADVPSPKKLTGAAGRLAGARIPLCEPTRGVLGVAEGIETALAAFQASGIPCIATYCAGAVAGFLWPADVQRLVIFADNDKAGREAAGTLQRRALAARLRCETFIPTAEGADWADIWAARDDVLRDARKEA